MGSRGHSALTLAMRMPPSGEATYHADVRKDDLIFSEFCASMLKDGHFEGAVLPNALRSVRALEQSSGWVMSWILEQVEIFGNDTASAAYGSVWFNAWATAANGYDLKQVLTSQGDRIPKILVAGSALGEHCLYAVALRAHCMGTNCSAIRWLNLQKN